MKTKLCLLAAAAALFAFSINSALALTLHVAQDASSCKTGDITLACGKAACLTVAENQTALLEFDLSNPATSRASSWSFTSSRPARLRI